MKWLVPLADVDFDQEELQSVERVLKTKWLTMGAITQQFEADFSAQTNIEHCIAVTNCTAGLHLALVALGVGPGDEVIVPSLSFVATANAVCYTGAIPVFADIISEEDLTISPSSVVDAISARTKGIIVMHYGGYACDMEQIMAIAKEHGLFVLEDSAHAVCASLNGTSLGGFGDVGCFSFFPNKNMTTGEGGIVTTNDAKLAQKIRLLRSHGMTSLTWDRHEGHAWSYDVVDLGFNYRIDEIRSALGIAQLKKLRINNKKRQTLTDFYWQRLKDTIPEVELPFTQHRGKSTYHIMPILLPRGSNRKDIMDNLKEIGIQTSIHYPPIHSFTYYKEHYSSGHLEKTEAIAERELTLPLYPGMNTDAVQIVVTSLLGSMR